MRLNRGHPQMNEVNYPPILVWNPNPTLDLVSSVDSLSFGNVHRSDVQAISAGGKGTLVVRARTLRL